MNKLIQKGRQLAKQKEAETRLDVKTALRDALSDDFAIEEQSEAIVVKGSGLSEQIVDNSSLRDVAFLMRGVR